MVKVGITGGIGSGKSVICSVFNKLGIPVFSADNAAKVLMEKNQLVKSRLIALLGDDIYLENGALHRNKMAGIIFNDQIALRKVNEIVHPVVRNEFNSWAKKQTSAYVVQEAAILFESGQSGYFDKIVLVIAPLELRIKRVMQRDNTTREKVLERMKNQWADEKKIEQSDFVVLNDNSAMVLPQILEIHQKLI